MIILIARYYLLTISICTNIEDPETVTFVDLYPVDCVETRLAVTQLVACKTWVGVKFWRWVVGGIQRNVVQRCGYT